MNIIQAGLRAFEFILTLITMALIGNVIAMAFAGNPSSINYAIFVTVIDMIAVLVGFATIFVEGGIVAMAAMVLDGLACLFSFIAGVVLAAKLGVHSCGNYTYTHTNSLTDGSQDTSGRCHELQASCAFFWFLFALFAATLAMTFLNRDRGTSTRRPALSKV